MYLTKIEMKLSDAAVRSALKDAQKMHRLVSGFFQMQRKEAEILYRCRERDLFVDLYMYSASPVDPDRVLPGMRLVAQRDVTSWIESMQDGDIFQFQLVTFPFRKVAETGAKNSRRRALRTQVERFAWLNRKAEQGGFQILSAEESPAEKLTAYRPDEVGGHLTVDAFCYTGLLRVSDVVQFRRTVCTGIGPEKAYGLGMLMLKGSGN